MAGFDTAGAWMDYEDEGYPVVAAGTYVAKVRTYEHAVPSRDKQGVASSKVQIRLRNPETGQVVSIYDNHLVSHPTARSYVADGRSRVKELLRSVGHPRDEGINPKYIEGRKVDVHLLVERDSRDGKMQNRIGEYAMEGTISRDKGYREAEAAREPERNTARGDGPGDPTEDLDDEPSRYAGDDDDL